MQELTSELWSTASRWHIGDLAWERGQGHEGATILGWFREVAAGNALTAQVLETKTVRAAGYSVVDGPFFRVQAVDPRTIADAPKVTFGAPSSPKVTFGDFAARGSSRNHPSGRSEASSRSA